MQPNDHTSLGLSLLFFKMGMLPPSCSIFDKNLHCSCTRKIFGKPRDLPVFFCWNFRGTGQSIILSRLSLCRDLRQRPFSSSFCFISLGQQYVCVFMTAAGPLSDHLGQYHQYWETIFNPSSHKWRCLLSLPSGFLADFMLSKSGPAS